MGMVLGVLGEISQKRAHLSALLLGREYLYLR